MTDREQMDNWDGAQNFETDLDRVFRAGRVMRWHTNPEVVDTNDRNDGHSARVARIILALWPDAPRDLIVAALMHDDGEIAVGDVSAVAKQASPQIAALLEQAEAQSRQELWGYDLDLSNVNRARLKLADRLDAYQWVKFHRPQALKGDGWPEAAQWLTDEASRLGVGDQVARVVDVQEAG